MTKITCLFVFFILIPYSMATFNSQGESQIGNDQQRAIRCPSPKKIKYLSNDQSYILDGGAQWVVRKKESTGLNLISSMNGNSENIVCVESCIDACGCFDRKKTKLEIKLLGNKTETGAKNSVLCQYSVKILRSSLTFFTCIPICTCDSPSSQSGTVVLEIAAQEGDV